MSGDSGDNARLLDGSTTSDDSGGLLTFLNGDNPDAVDFTVVDESDPVNWIRLAGSIVGSVTLGVASSLYAIPQGLAAGAENIYGGAEDAYEALISGVFDPFTAIAVGAYDVALIEELGIFAGPVAVGIVLAAMYVFVRGMRLAIEAARGGGRL